MKTSKVGVPHRLKEWLSSWFINCTARRQVNGYICPFTAFKEDLPQVSILSPLLFTININDLLVKFEEDTFVSTYADYLVIARTKDMIIASLQPVDKVIAWSTKTRLPPSHPNARRPSSDWTAYQRSGNPTPPLTENNVLQCHTDFLGCQVRPAVHYCRACPKALPINA